MKRIILCLLFAASSVFAGPVDVGWYLLRNNTNVTAWLSNKGKEFAYHPFTMTGSGADYCLDKWDEAATGIARPSWALLTNPATDALAVAWITDYKYTVKQTPQWVSLTNDIAAANATLDLYSITALTNSIAQVTDAKTKAALQDVKACIKQAHDEAQAIHKEVKDLKTILGKYLQVEP